MSSVVENTLPNGWVLKPLGDIVKLQNGFAFKRSLYKDSGTPIVRIKNIKKEEVKLDDVVRFNLNDYKKNLDHYKIEENDILIAMSGATTGKIGLYKRKDVAYLNQRVGLFRIENDDLRRYLLYFLSTQVEDNLLKSLGAAQPNLSSFQINEMEIPLPPLEEQKRIVDKIDGLFAEIDKAISLTEESLKQAKNLLPSVLKEVFEKGKADGWEEKKLTEVCEKIFAGGDKPKDYFSKTKTDECSIPIFSNGIKEDGLYGYTNEPKVIKPSVTISARGTIGYPVYRTEPFVPIIRLIVLTPYEKIVTANYLMIVIKNLEILNVGSAIPQLTVPMIKNYSVLIPSQDIQETISDLVSVCETKITQTQSKLKEQLAYLKQLKSSILSQAFKGEL